MKACFLISAIVTALCTTNAAEPVVRDGLLLWLDASNQKAARRAAGIPSLTHLQPVDVAFDGSANASRAVQAVASRRPLYFADDETAYWRFDGEDDFFQFNPANHQPIAELTVFVLAAPSTNRGGFAGLLGTAAFGQNDYTSGLNFDFGPYPTKEISVLNVEGAGALGFRDLLVPGFLNAAERPFGDFHVFTVRSKVGKAGVEVFLDGFKGGERERTESRLGLDQLIIGARIFSNDPSQPPYAQGFFAGALAEVLVYHRALSEDERRTVEQSLLAKSVRLHALLRGAKGHALEPVKDPPVVQMLVPGFTIHELPLKLGNVNNLRYRHDGRLVAQGYDGRISLLTDSNGDGLEDRQEFFWDQHTLRSPIGIALTSKDDPRGDGVFVASKGKVSLILDANRDGRADEEKIIASGWAEPFHSVDAMGLAVDPKDGAIYFGRGCANFVEAFLIDKATGKSQYRLADERGTIQRISADFSRREIVCTGVRFTCALAFNRRGDLFATDQEGATWLPNGNPLDELLHIERGKHYGFPPRHPKHLPDVRDEPAIYEYGPQHQSTVGMVFNEGVNGGPAFGPDHWQGDALVCGESRGKLYRTKLASTPLGYVAENQLIACLSLLTVDACVSPQGDLVVACHSGPPDWGTGPTGEGRIFKIRYAGRTLPQPVRAWTAGPDEFRVAFDRPLDPADWTKAKDQVRIEAGPYVSAGDRFEVIRPGYQVVRDQMTIPRRSIEVLGLKLSDDRRALVLRVPRQSDAVNYGITLPVPERWRPSGGIPQHPQLDLLATLNGVAASVISANGTERRVVLPHPSLVASAELTKGSAEHAAFLQSASSPGATLTLRGAVDVINPYVPAIQPGAKLDWDQSTDSFATAVFSIRTDFGAESEVLLEMSSPPQMRPIKSFTVKDPSQSTNGWFLAKGELRHTLSPARVFLPWATEPKRGTESQEIARARTDVKGHWLRGRRVFFSEAGCGTCHTIRGEGMAFGPDLSNLVHRDRDSVWQDILQPAATINPDHTGTLITLNDGTKQAGLVRSLQNDKILLGLPAGAQLEIARNKIASMEPLKGSLMPTGIVDTLSFDQREDLLTFLLTDPLQPAQISRTDPPAPPPRRLAELTAALGGNPSAPINPTPLKILLCAGPKDHGPDEHDYPLWLERWSRLLALADNVTVQTSMGFPKPAQLTAADVTVFFNANPEWNAEKVAALDEYHRRGGGAVYLHYAVDGGKDPNAVGERMGLSFTLGSKFRHGEFDLVFTQPTHPITRGMPTLHFTDETYWNMRGDTSRLTILGTVVEENSPRPQLWTLERGRSRIVGCIPGHYTWTFDDPAFRVLVFRAICWTARLSDMDRLAELSLIGARYVQ